MSQGAPTSPTPLNYGQPPARNDLRKIAMRQKTIMYCILGYIVLFASQFVLPPAFRFPAGLLAFAVSITGAVFVFMLSLSLYNVLIGVLLGILTLFPVLGLIPLLIINGKATKVLREYGIQVGLMGARSDQIPAAGQTPVRGGEQ